MNRKVDSFLIPSTKVALLQKFWRGEKSASRRFFFLHGLLPHSYWARQQNWLSDGDCQSVSWWVQLSIVPDVTNLWQQGDKSLGEEMMASIYSASPTIFLQRKCSLFKCPVYLLRHLDNLPSLEREESWPYLQTSICRGNALCGYLTRGAPSLAGSKPFVIPILTEPHNRRGLWSKS